MTDTSERRTTGLGGFVFFLTAVAVVEFFWWLLIFDHGVVAAH